MKKARSLALLLVMLASLFLPGCKANNTPAAPSADGTAPYTVYTSNFLLADFTRKIGGSRVTVVNILPSGAEPHSFEPSTRLMADLQEAMLFIVNGAGLEHYLDKMTAVWEKSGPHVVDTSTGIEIIRTDNVPDPHLWLSPANAARQGEAILQALIQADPEGRSYYEENYRQFSRKLEELDGEFRETLAKTQRKDIVVPHAAFAYLCRDYGLTQLPVMGINAEGEPPPGTLKDIIETIKSKGITHVFYEKTATTKITATLTEETGTQALPLNILDAVTAEDEKAGADYFSLMRENLDSLKKGLGFQP